MAKQEFSAPYGAVRYAEMGVGGDVAMIGTGGPPECDPAAISPTGHGVPHEQANAAGTRIGPEDTGFWTRCYRALGPEGYEWSFGPHGPAS